VFTGYWSIGAHNCYDEQHVGHIAMTATCTQVKQSLPYIGDTAAATERAIGIGSLLEYKRGRTNGHKGVVAAIDITDQGCVYTVHKTAQLDTWVQRYEAESGEVFSVKRKAAAKLIDGLDKAKCLVVCEETAEVLSSKVTAVGVVFDAALYKKMDKAAALPGWVHWTYFAIDDDEDLCCLGKNDAAVYSYSLLKSSLRQLPTTEVRAPHSTCGERCNHTGLCRPSSW
jgi:hypothetical protein